MVHPNLENDYSSYSMSAIYGFFGGFVNDRQALDERISTLDPTYLSIVSDVVAKQRQFTLVKPTDDVTYMLIRASLKDTPLKTALVFGTDNLRYVLTMQTPDAKVKNISENRSFKNGKADVVQFSFGQMMMTMETSLVKSAGS